MHDSRGSTCACEVCVSREGRDTPLFGLNGYRVCAAEQGRYGFQMSGRHSSYHYFFFPKIQSMSPVGKPAEFCMQNDAKQDYKIRSYVLNRVVKLPIFF